MKNISLPLILAIVAVMPHAASRAASIDAANAQVRELFSAGITHAAVGASPARSASIASAYDEVRERFSASTPSASLPAQRAVLPDDA